MTEWEQIPARLELEGVSVSYGEREVLRDVSFQVPHGSRVAVVGPNGAGKSTLFKALVGLLPVRSGQILIHGKPLGHHKDCVAYVPQREEVDWGFPVTVSDVVMMGRYGRLGWLRRPTAADHQAVKRSLEQMGMTHVSGRPIADLSGGQQQRVFLARALAQQPHVLLMDEPFTGVDASTQEATLKLLDELQAEGVTVMVSTHDLNMAARRFDLVMFINGGVVAYGEPATVFTRENVSQVFGAHVLYLDDLMVVDECCPEGHAHAETPKPEVKR